MRLERERGARHRTAGEDGLQGPDEKSCRYDGNGNDGLKGAV